MSMIKTYRLIFVTLLLASNAVFGVEPNIANAAVLRHISAILRVPVDKLKVDLPFSKQVVPGDALDIVEIVMAIEDDLRIEINDEALDKKIGSKNVSELPQKLTIKMLQETVNEIYVRKPKSGVLNAQPKAR